MKVADLLLKEAVRAIELGAFSGSPVNADRAMDRIAILTSLELVELGEGLPAATHLP